MMKMVPWYKQGVILPLDIRSKISVVATSIPLLCRILNIKHSRFKYLAMMKIERRVWVCFRFRLSLSFLGPNSKQCKIFILV